MRVRRVPPAGLRSLFHPLLNAGCPQPVRNSVIEPVQLAHDLRALPLLSRAICCFGSTARIQFLAISGTNSATASGCISLMRSKSRTVNSTIPRRKDFVWLVLSLRAAEQAT